MVTTPLMLRGTAAIVQHLNGETSEISLGFGAYAANFAMLFSGWLASSSKEMWAVGAAFIVGAGMLVASHYPLWSMTNSEPATLLVAATSTAWLAYGIVFVVTYRSPWARMLWYNLLDVVSKNINTVAIAALVL